MKRTKQPNEYVPAYSADFIVGFNWLHRAMTMLSKAFIAAKP